jgi:hypothetical protein
MSDRPDVRSDDGQWLTKRELARVRGVALASAERMIRRHQWRRQQDNQGRALVFVPPEFLERHDADRTDTPDATPDIPSDDRGDVTPADRGDISSEINAFERAMTMLTEAKDEEIAALQSLADQALAQVADTQAERDRERQRADKAEASLADERVRADQVRTQVDELRAQLAELREDDVPGER